MTTMFTTARGPPLSTLSYAHLSTIKLPSTRVRSIHTPITRGFFSAYGQEGEDVRSRPTPATIAFLEAIEYSIGIC